jgi:hypothetical protein
VADCGAISWTPAALCLPDADCRTCPGAVHKARGASERDGEWTYASGEPPGVSTILHHHSAGGESSDDRSTETRPGV